MIRDFEKGNKVAKTTIISLTSRTNITFYGGIHEIGGNKFLVQDKDTRIFLDL